MLNHPYELNFWFFSNIDTYIFETEFIVICSEIFPSILRHLPLTSRLLSFEPEWSKKEKFRFLLKAIFTEKIRHLVIRHSTRGLQCIKKFTLRNLLNLLDMSRRGAILSNSFFMYWKILLKSGTGKVMK